MCDKEKTVSRIGNDVQSKTVKNLAWKFAERCGAQGVAFVVSIILARLLEPSDYGLIALVTVFTSILQVFIDNGLGSALIQKKDADDLDFSTVFYTNIILCIALYLVAYIIAPFIAEFYNENLLSPVLRVLSLTIIISALMNIQQAYVAKKLIFKKFFFSTLSGTICGAIIGICFAYKGYGVWALVAQQLTNVVINTFVLWFTVKWRPQLKFSFIRLKTLFSYGGKLLLSGLIATIYNDIRQLIIGKTYSADDLGYYNKGKQFPNLVVTNINASIDSVLLPVMAECQNDRNRVRALTRRSIKISSYIMWPFMFGLMAVGEELIIILLTEKWLPCVPFLYIFCFVNGMMPIHTANLNAIKAMGRSDLYLWTEVIKKCIGLTLIFISMNISVLAIAASSVVYTILASIINSFPNKKLLDYSYLDQLRDMLPSFLLAGCMFGVLYILPIMGLNIYLILLIKLIVGIVFYFAMSILLRFESFKYLMSILKRFVRQ